MPGKKAAFHLPHWPWPNGSPHISRHWGADRSCSVTNVSFGAENATDSSDDDEGPLSGEGSDDEEAALIGRFNYVAVNQEIMRNVGVHTLILRTLRSG